MAFDTYANTQTAIASYLNRTDLTTNIVDFISLAESEMQRRFVSRMKQGLPFPRRIMQRSDASVAEDDEFVAVPTDFLGPLTFTLNSDPITELDYLDYANFLKEKARNYWRGTPRYYTVVNGEFQFFPVVDQTYTAELTYLLKFPALSNTNTSNWVLANYPDAYLYGASAHAWKFLRDSVRAAEDTALFIGIIDDICNADPMPSDKATLRTEFPALTRGGYMARYDINYDTF